MTEDLRLELLPAEGPILDQILAATFDIWHDGLNPAGYRRYYSAQRGTAWGRSHLHRWALVGASEHVARLLAITQADRLLPVFSSVADVERAWNRMS